MTSSRWELIKYLAKQYEHVVAVTHTRRYNEYLKRKLKPALRTTNNVQYWKHEYLFGEYYSLYLLWEGQTQREMEKAVNEVKFCYDHLTDFTIVIIAPRIIP